MGELQIAGIDSIDITRWDFGLLKKQLSEQLDYYRGIAYTEDMGKLHLFLSFDL